MRKICFRIFFVTIATLLGEGVGIAGPSLGASLGSSLGASPTPSLVGLAQSRSWQKLLFIPDGKILPFQTVINDPSFFFQKTSSASTIDPLAELRASVDAFRQTVDPQKPNKHPQCLFPARYQWVEKHLGSAFKEWPKPKCQDLENFQKIADYEQVQMVFTNYYINNPASMFGHTFLKLKRKQAPSSPTYHPLLDDAVNFAAAVDPGDGLIYPIKGLTGGYPGFFSLIPYHRKTQEYNNYESRDLWEYPLDLTQDEVQRLTLVLWELGGKKTPYYYFTQNCSFILLSLLEAAAPRHQLTNGFLLFAIPADTLRAAVRDAGTGAPPQYRPSSMSRFQMRLAYLNAEQISLLKTLAITDQDYPKVGMFTRMLSSPLWKSCDDSCRLKVYDAALEFFEFDERLGGEYLPMTYAKARQTVLHERAKINKPSPALQRPPLSTPPHLGHPSSFIELRVGEMVNNLGSGVEESNKTNHQGFSIIRWRPAVQDFSDPSQGYNKGMELKFLDTTLRYQPQNHKDSLWLENLTILSASSLPVQMPLVKSWGWNYALGLERKVQVDANTSIEWPGYRTYLQGGPGLAQTFFDESLWVYAFLNVDLGYSEGAFQGGPLLVGGLIYETSPIFKIFSKIFGERVYNSNTYQLRSTTMGMFKVTKSITGVLNLELQKHTIESSLGFRTYF